MVKFNSNKGKHGGARLGGYLPTIFMVFLGSGLAVMTSHLIYGNNSQLHLEEDEEHVKTVKSAKASKVKPSNQATKKEAKDYYDAIFKNPLRPLEEKLKTMPDALELSKLDTSQPPKGAGQFMSVGQMRTSGAAGQKDGWPHSGPFLNAETMYPLGNDFQEVMEKLPEDKLEIFFLNHTKEEVARAKDPVPEVVAPSNASKSIFDCDGPYGRCVYWYPSHFFANTTVKDIQSKEGKDAVIGPKNQYAGGGRFYYLLEQMEALLRAHKLWMNMPYIGLWTMTFEPHRMNPVTGKPFEQKNVTFIHIHKTGGTTIVRHANSQMTALTGRPTDQYRVFMWQWLVGKDLDLKGRPLPPSRLRGFNGKPPDDKAKMHKILFDRAVAHLKTATTFPPTWQRKDHELFAVVRDPLDRFVSSIGQAMGALGSTKNGVAAELKQTCINAEEYSLEASQFTLQCMINIIKERGFFFEIHFTPQSVLTAFATQMLPDLPVALFHMDDMPIILTSIGCDPNKKVRDGHGNYRPHKVLAGMTADDYTPDLVRQTCLLYEVDVVMLRILGHEVPRCDPYIPKKH